eukprot:TRINITY_DN3158_c0_g2_i2.p2 TRINITY_DN3158_c0_g2~~TRINITY_DN3158_c0_g2_i2.p2  ORF type:complete len:228 (-),score=101.12 TRINITY_DN3158_c0_g2_i2:369-1052(-)
MYGGLDGVVSVFVSIAATAGSTNNVTVALVLGLAKLFAGGLSMGVGDWLATDAEVDLARRERAREEWECENFLEGEIEEMVHLYVKKGIDEASARRLVNIMAKNRKGFVDIMMSEELGMALDTEDKKPWAHGLVNFGSFMTFGLIPLLVYIIVVAADPNIRPETVFYISIGTTALTLIGLGIAQSIVTKSGGMLKNAAILLALGAFASGLGYGMSYLLAYTTGVTLE